MNTARIFIICHYYCDLLFQPKLNWSINWGVQIINTWFLFCVNAHLGFFGHLGISWYIRVLKGIPWKCNSLYLVSEVLNWSLMHFKTGSNIFSLPVTDVTNVFTQTVVTNKLCCMASRIPTPTNQKAKGGYLCLAQVDVPQSLKPFLHLTASLGSWTDTLNYNWGLRLR